MFLREKRKVAGGESYDYWSLVCTPGGLPLSDEVFSGNQVDVTTVEEIVKMMEEKYGAAERVRVMDRGMVSEVNITFLRERKALYIVGTPKSELRHFEAALRKQEHWAQVQDGLEARLVQHPDGEGAEKYVLCLSTARAEKERAMLTRQLASSLPLSRALSCLRQPFPRASRRLGSSQPKPRSAPPKAISDCAPSTITSNPAWTPTSWPAFWPSHSGEASNKGW